MGQHGLRQPSADALAAISLSDNDVRPVSVGREVGNGTPERDQGFTVEDGEADGVVDGPGECLGCERTAPIGRAEQCEDGRGVEAPTIRGKAERATLGLDWHILHELAILTWSRLPNGSRLSCGRLARRPKRSGRTSRARRGTTQRSEEHRERPEATTRWSPDP